MFMNEYSDFNFPVSLSTFWSFICINFKMYPINPQTSSCFYFGAVRPASTCVHNMTKRMSDITSHECLTKMYIVLLTIIKHKDGQYNSTGDLLNGDPSHVIESIINFDCFNYLIH